MDEVIFSDHSLAGMDHAQKGSLLTLRVEIWRKSSVGSSSAIAYHHWQLFS
jgi:hypothetical protein